MDGKILLVLFEEELVLLPPILLFLVRDRLRLLVCLRIPATTLHESAVRLAELGIPVSHPRREVPGRSVALQDLSSCRFGILAKLVEELRASEGVLAGGASAPRGHTGHVASA